MTKTTAPPGKKKPPVSTQPPTTTKTVTYGLIVGGNIQISMTPADAAAQLTAAEQAWADGGTAVATINRPAPASTLHTPWSNVAWITVS